MSKRDDRIRALMGRAIMHQNAYLSREDGYRYPRCDIEEYNMSIYRTVRKIVDCPSCNGTGRVYTDHSKGTEGPCDACGGKGRIEINTRANRASVAQAEVAIKQQIPPGSARKAAKARLSGGDGETEDKRGFVNEDE